MTTLFLASALCLVVVFLVAAVGKLASPGSAHRATSQLGGPQWFAPLVVPAEIAVVGLLLVRPALGSLAAGLVLSAFTVVLARVVRSGRKVACGCFGSADTTPVTGRTVARNLALMLLCVPAAGSPMVNTASGDTIVAAVAVSAGVFSVAMLVSALLQMKRITGSIFTFVTQVEG